LREFQREIESMGRRAVALSLDVRDQESIRRMAADAAAHFGRIDILVNNAGCNVRKPALEVTWDDWNLVLDTNLRGTFFVSQAVAPHMIARKHGRIINIGSVTAVAGYAGLGPYGASRGGVKQLTMSLADDWGVHGITVNCLAPGWFKTAQNAVMYENQEWVRYLCDRIPLKRPGQPRDLGRGHCFSGLRRQRVHHRPDAAGRWRHFHRRDPRAAQEKMNCMLFSGPVCVMLARVKSVLRMLAGVSIVACAMSIAQGQTSPQPVLPLWPDGAPGALGKEPKDIPTLTPFFPDAEMATGAGMVICPGGGYAGLAAHEGRGLCALAQSTGHRRLRPQIPARLLRLPASADAGGCGAGHAHGALPRGGMEIGPQTPRHHRLLGRGHLASTLLTHFDAGHADAADPIERVSCRPDLGVLCYAVITMGDETHKGSRDNLLGKDPSPELIKELSNELHVTKETPPCFIFHTYDDTAVPVENSLEFAAALRRAKVPFELHIYQHGAHGMGLGTKSASGPEQMHPWARECQRWLKEQGFGK
jgi:NAD(P)-dependent dehydrogenase (short-subunit alcohol dehydrogenase family)